MLGSIADGDLTQDAVQDYLGDFQSIKRSLDRIQSAMNSTMGQIAVSAAQVSSGSEQVSSSAQNLAQGATEQASSVEELAARISEISDQVKDTADGALEVRSQSHQVGQEASACTFGFFFLIKFLLTYIDKKPRFPNRQRSENRAVCLQNKRYQISASCCRARPFIRSVKCSFMYAH